MSHYENLGVHPSATRTEIQARYDALAREVHPANGGDPVMFRILNESYRILIDPTRRAAYDIEFLGAAENPPPPRGVAATTDSSGMLLGAAVVGVIGGSVMVGLGPAALIVLFIFGMFFGVRLLLSPFRNRRNRA